MLFGKSGSVFHLPLLVFLDVLLATAQYFMSVWAFESAYFE
jgi:hypothetical protein